MDDFELFTQDDRNKAAYIACIGGMGAIGVAVGRFGGLHGVLLGAAVGVGYGLLACKRLAPAIERKLLSTSERLTEFELSSALKALRDQAGVKTKDDAMLLLATVRQLSAVDPSFATRPQPACMALPQAAQMLISHRASAA